MALLGLAGASALGQVPAGGVVRGAFTVPVYDRESPSRVVAMLNGVGVDPQPNGQVRLQSVQVSYFGEPGQTNLVVRGTQCLYDARTQTATSAEALRIVSGDGRLSVAGQGFIWWRTNNDLAISNQVRTELIPAPRASPPELVGDSPLEILSDTWRLHYRSNLVTYQGRVRVANTNLTLTAQTLDILGTTNNAAERIIARREVLVVHRPDGSRIACDEAEYLDDGQRAQVRLSGHPRWEDGLRTGQADWVVLDTTERSLRAYGNTQFRFPRVELGSQLPLGFAASGGTRASAGDPNLAFLEVQAPMCLLQFPATNGPVQSLVAETNVVIRDAARSSVGRARRLVYHNGQSLELTGEPSWSGQGGELQAAWLGFDLVNRRLAARTNAVLRLPWALIGERFGSAPAPEAAAATGSAYIEIRSDYMVSFDQALRFGDRVRVEYLEAGQRLGELTCASLEVPYRDRVQALDARGGVDARWEPPADDAGRTTVRQFRGQAVRVAFDDAGQIQSGHATGGVFAQEQRRVRGQETGPARRLECERVDATFVATNRVERAVAEGGVVLSQGERVVQGARAVYTGADDVVRLTGNPTATFPEGRIVEAETLAYDRATGRYQVSGKFRTEWNRVPLGTNQPTFLRTSSPP